MLGALLFEEWKIHGCRYKNENPTTNMEENSKFVVMQESMIDKDGYTVLLPARERSLMGMPNVIQHRGRICQLASPMVGSVPSSMLPMVGCATDSEICVQFEWIYQAGYEQRTVRKIGKMELERLPATKAIESIKYGISEQNVGDVWEGTLEVTIERCEGFDEAFGMPMTQHPLRRSVGSGNNGVYNLATNPHEPAKTVGGNTPIGEDVKNSNEGKESVTQLYHVEMVIESSNGESEIYNDYENQNENETTSKTPREE